MPRRSSSSSEITQIQHKPEPPAPPESLTPKQRAQWTKFINCMPRDYFDAASAATLAELCRAIDYCDHYAAWINDHPIDQLRPDNYCEHQKVMRHYLKASKAVEMLSVRLRFVPSTRVQQNHAAHQTGRSGAKPLAGARRPWDRIFPIPRRDDDGGDNAA